MRAVLPPAVVGRKVGEEQREATLERPRRVGLELYVVRGGHGHARADEFSLAATARLYIGGYGTDTALYFSLWEAKLQLS